MKIIMLSTFLLFTVLATTGSCKKEDFKEENQINGETMDGKTNPIAGTQIKVKVGTKSFNATLYSNKTTDAFKTLLPLSLNMTDLNRNEKKFDLTVNLPTNIEEIGTIQEGDILLWGNNTLVLFYKSFNTPYRYTKIGKIVDVSGLAAVLGSGDVKVIFEY
jgi:hypothetical protein